MMSQPAPSASARGTADRCPHFGECGGCQTQDVSYPGQLEAKQRFLEELFAEFWDKPISVLPSPVVWHYRNKVDFNFALKHYPEPPPKDFRRETVLGFTSRGEWYKPFEVEVCLIAPRGCDALLQAVREWAKGQQLRAYDSRSNTGFLRALLVREGARSGERMVALFTSPGKFDVKGFTCAVIQSFSAHSIHRGIFTRSARGAFAEHMDLLAGPPHIHETMRVPDIGASRELSFRISPFSFFQTNTLAAEVLYGEIRRWVRETGAEILYDLYGGAGGIAFACSDLVKLVRSVENEPSATSDGERNARLNGIENVFFTTQPMRHYLRNLYESGGMEPNSVAIVDPPRGGLTPKPLQRLIDCGPPRILYVSCKAATLREELPVLLKTYRLDRLWAVDLFPHTTHVEVLASFSRV
jgi:23S rRNA (uracil1939-C5)-methyltransferase